MDTLAIVLCIFMITIIAIQMIVIHIDSSTYQLIHLLDHVTNDRMSKEEEWEGSDQFLMLGILLILLVYILLSALKII